jgi:hypothetical protein
MSVTVTNTTRRLAVFILPHDEFCEQLGRCACERRRDQHRLPTTLTVPAGTSLTDVPAAVLTVRAVAAAIRAGELRVEPHTPRPNVTTNPLEGGPEGALTPANAGGGASHERRAAVVQGRRR